MLTPRFPTKNITETQDKLVYQSKTTDYYIAPRLSRNRFWFIALTTSKEIYRYRSITLTEATKSEIKILLHYQLLYPYENRHNET